MIVCSFAGGIGMMRAGDQSNPIAVLQVLAKDGRFSVFDATERASIAGTLTGLKNAGLIEYPEPQPAFPWCKVVVTAAGLERIEREARR